MNEVLKSRLFPDLILGESRLGGRGVFSGRRFYREEVVLEFGGAIYRSSELPDPYFEDLFLQVGPDLYLGPGKGPDTLEDFVNHSCDPNAAVIIRPEGKVVLAAIRPIAPLEEIVYDYSLLMVDDDWTMNCRCGSPSCRGTVREYRTLSSPTKARYRRLEVVPPYVLARDSSSRSSVG